MLTGNFLKGGAIAIDISRSGNSPAGSRTELHVVNSRFTKNLNMLGGTDTGFIGQQLDGSPIEANRLLRLKEPSPSGGAIFASRINSVHISNVTFSDNVGVAGGGALYLHSIADAQIHLSKFLSNKVQLATNRVGPPSNTMHGGAVYVVSPVTGSFEVSQSEFIENHAGYGGALHVVGLPVFKVKISTCTFIENEAVYGGGGAFLRAVDTQWVSSIAKLNIGKFGGGIMVTNGGKLFVRRDGKLENNPSVFEENYAFRGGGVLLHGAGKAIFGLQFSAILWSLKFQMDILSALSHSYFFPTILCIILLTQMCFCNQGVQLFKVQASSETRPLFWEVAWQH